MKRWKSLTAALCAAVLLCGFSAVPAFAYADGGEGENYGDPTMTEETTVPEPEPTIEPGEGFSEEGNLVTRDLLYDEHTNKQFITVQTEGGNTFYIVIDYDKPVDEEGEQYETYFLSMTDEADLPRKPRSRSRSPPSNRARASRRRATLLPAICSMTSTPTSSLSRYRRRAGTPFTLSLTMTSPWTRRASSMKPTF